MLAPGTLLQNRYSVVRHFGQGGMGSVYEAIDQRLNTTVALKECLFFEERLRRQFEREALLLAKLDHPALPRVLDHFSETGKQFLVMQFIAGEDLGERLQRSQQPFSKEEVLRWADQLLDALEYMSKQSPPVVHRDIKPQNLKLNSRGQVVLLDFGLAKGTSDEPTSIGTRTVLGYSLAYAPLEQILQVDAQWVKHLSVFDAEKVERLKRYGTNHRSDLYSLSATLLHLVLGEEPPHAPTRALTVWSGRDDPLPAVLKRLDPRVAYALEKAMELDPADRFTDAASMRRAFQETQKLPTTLPAFSSSQDKTLLLPEEPTPITVQMPLQETALSQESDTLANRIEAKPVLPLFSNTIRNKESEQTKPSIKNIERRSFQGLPILLSSVGALMLIGLVALVVVAGVIIRPYIWNKNQDETASGDNVSKTPTPPPPKPTPSPSVTNKDEPHSWAVQRTMLGHKDSVHAIAFSPDGKLAASASWDTSIILWDVETGEQKRVLTHGYHPHQLIFSPDGKFLYSSGGNGVIKMWDIETGNAKTIISVKQEIINLALSSDGTLLACDCSLKGAKVLDAKTGALKLNVTRNDYTWTVALSRDGKYVAAAGGHKNLPVTIWEVQTGKIARTFAEDGNTSSLAFSPDGKVLATGSNFDGIIKLYDTETGALLKTLPKRGGQINQLDFSPDRSLLAALSSNVYLYSMNKDKWIGGISAGSFISGFAFSADGKMIGTVGYDDKSVKIWK